MKYDFDRPLNRRSEWSVKWNCANNELPMWVADMDFEVAQPIRKAIEERLSHPCFGYSEVPPSWASSYPSFWSHRFATPLKEDALLFSLGIIPSLSACVRAFTSVGDEIIILTPVYNVFNHSIENNARKVIEVPLRNENERYSIDFPKLEEACAREKAKMLILCNPHNPVGRAWNKEELSRLASLASAHNVLVVSDEVHGPITPNDKPYVPYVSSCQEARYSSITLLAPTKSFNIAGVQTSACYVESKALRDKLSFALNADEVMEGNFLSYISSIAAFNESDDWLAQVNDYIQENYAFFLSFMQSNLPKIKLAPLEATYLLWADISSYRKDDVAFCQELREKTGLWITPGSTYGKAGKGHVRINIACPKARLEDCLKRLFAYCKSLG